MKFFDTTPPSRRAAPSQGDTVTKAYSTLYGHIVFTYFEIRPDEITPRSFQPGASLNLSPTYISRHSHTWKIKTVARNGTIAITTTKRFLLKTRSRCSYWPRHVDVISRRDRSRKINGSEDARHSAAHQEPAFITDNIDQGRPYVSPRGSFFPNSCIRPG